MSGKLKLPELAALLADKADDFCAWLIPDGTIENGQFRAKSVYGGKAPKSKGAFVCEISGPRKGKWCDHREASEKGGACLGGDLIDLIRINKSCDYKEAAKIAREFLGIRDDDIKNFKQPYRAEPFMTSAEEWQERQKKVEIAGRVWKQAKPIKNTRAEDYLISRGIELSAWPATLRYLAECFHPFEKRSFPALIAQKTEWRGPYFAGVQRIYLHPDKPERLQVENSKIELGAGGVVKLGPCLPKIGIAEGVETALSIMVLNENKYPVWAGLSTSGLRAARFTREVKRIDIFADLDEAKTRKKDQSTFYPGQEAAIELRDRMRAEGRAAHAWFPEGDPPLDFNDVLRKRRGIK